jgi:MmyB-like transcription regulator ligand binding domain
VFASLWEQRPVARTPARRKSFLHPELGAITLDCDALTVQGSDLSVIVYTAPAGSPDAESLALLGAIGLQSFSD